MKLETLAKRISQKTDCPDLGQYILTGVLPETTQCIPWNGALSPKVPTWNKSWDRRARSFYPRLTLPKPTIRFENKLHQSIPRLMYTLVNEPEFGFRMYSLCGNPRCINPHHWEVRRLGGMPAPDEEYVPINMDEPWTDKEVEEMLEIALESNPKSWEEIVDLPMMEGAPVEVMRATLLRLNKGHLTQ